MDVSAIAALLAGPGGAMVLLALVLWMAWKLATKALDIVSTHLAKIEEKFDTLTGAVQERLFEVKESLDEVQRGVAAANRKLRVVKEGERDDARES
jgi:uncharacterized protein YoxC